MSNSLCREREEKAESPAGREIMKLTLVVTRAALVAAAACVLGGGCGEQDRSAEVIAVVGGQPVTRGQLMEEAGRRYGALALRDLVDRSLIEQAARLKGVKSDPARADAKLEQAVTQAGGEKQLEAKLVREFSTLDLFKASLAQEALVEQIMAAQAAVTNREIESHYQSHASEYRHGEMIKGRLILLESRQNAQTVHGVLKEPGADFAGLAKSLSRDPGTQDQGGDMGWIERGDYAREITEAAFRLKPGQYTGVVAYPDGFALILVEDRKGPGVRPLEEVRDEIRGLLARQRQDALRPPQWAADQRTKARITVYDSALRERFELVRKR